MTRCLPCQETRGRLYLARLADDAIVIAVISLDLLRQTAETQGATEEEALANIADVEDGVLVREQDLLQLPDAQSE